MAVPPLRPAATALLAAGLIAGCAASGTAATAAGGGGGGGCAPWPSGSTRTVLLVPAGSDGRSYCVRTGQTVRVQLSGSQAIAPGSQPPRLLGNALAAERVHLPAPPSVSYLAVHPGTAALIIVRLPCHVARPAQSAVAAQGIGALARTGGVQCLIEQALRVSIIVR
jgi:hypothetical protein